MRATVKLAAAGAVIIAAAAAAYLVFGGSQPDRRSTLAAATLNQWTDALQAARSCEEVGLVAARLQDGFGDLIGNVSAVERVEEDLLAADVRITQYIASLATTCPDLPEPVLLLRESLGTTSAAIRALWEIQGGLAAASDDG